MVVGCVKGVVTAGVSSNSHLKFMVPRFNGLFYSFAILDLPGVFTVKNDIERAPSKLDSEAFACQSKCGRHLALLSLGHLCSTHRETRVARSKTFVISPEYWPTPNSVT